MPEICATFSEPLAEDMDYAPFVRLPEAGLTVEARGDQLCLGGLSHGRQVALTVRRGLPAASGETLARDVALSCYVRDRVPVERIDARTARGGSLSTQESVSTVLAAEALGQGEPDVAIDGQAVAGVVTSLAPGAHEVTNTGATATEVTLTAFGQPEVPPQAGGTGYAVTRRYYDLEGVPVDVAQVPLGTRMAVVIEVTPFAAGEESGGRLIVNDPLPARFEIDNPNLLRSGDIAALDWLTDLADPDMTQFLQDRFTAAVTWTQPSPFRLVYLVRAVTPGTFRHPAASVEDMYRPTFRGWSDGGQVRVGL